MSEIAGTGYYLAPEVFTNNYGKECDLWSVGVTIFYLLTGSFPFDADSPKKLVEVIKSGVFKMPDNISLDCQDLMSKLL